VTKLLANEREIRLARQHWAVFLPTVLVLLAVAVITAVILIVLPGSVSGHDIGTVKAVIGLVIGLFVVGAFLLRYLRWRYTTYVLTDKRILLSRGILSRYTESITLDRIQDTAITQSLIGRMFKAGTVEIESAGRDGSEELALIMDPVGFSNTLQAAVEAHRTGQPMPGTGAPPPAMAPPGGGSYQGYVPPGGAGSGPPPGYGPPSQPGGGV
jgi:uncharacterized membrane protein YdbT with pleckstrin-like domain